MSKTVSIIGCGWLGLPLAIDLLKRGYEVKGSTTSSEKLLQLTAYGIKAFCLNLPDESSELNKNLLESDTILFNIPPGLRRGTEDSYLLKIESFLALLKPSSFRKLIHVSTTSIYPDRPKLMSEKDADIDSIHYLVENQLSEFCKRNSKQFISARCGGLMGYERYPCKYYDQSSRVQNGDAGVNYIHRDDLVAIIGKLIESEKFNGAINISCPLHPSRQSVIEHCAQEAKRALPVFEPNGSGAKTINIQLLEKEFPHSFKYRNPLDFYYEYVR